MLFEPPSPCTGVCKIDRATGWCKGCARTMDEIAAWPTMARKEKRAVLRELPGRKDQ